MNLNSFSFNDCMWITGSGTSISFVEVMSEISEHKKIGGKLFIGTDSFSSGNSCMFATAICLHGATSQKGGRYFFTKNKYPKKSFSTLLQRIMKEVQKSIEVATIISEKFCDMDIEIHLDISTNNNGGTKKFVDALTGYTKSAGFKCKIKPDAWASASVADKHSK
jgi:uncharacterized protein